MKAIRVHETGGLDKLVYEDVPLPTPGPGQARVKLHAIGLNFIDIYFRTGLYKSPLPFIPDRRQPESSTASPRMSRP